MFDVRKKIRHPLVAFGLVFLTLGIYYLVWYYKVNRELRDIGRATGQEDQLGRKPLNSLLAITVGWLIIVPPFVSFTEPSSASRPRKNWPAPESV